MTSRYKVEEFGKSWVLYDRVLKVVIESFDSFVDAYHAKAEHEWRDIETEMEERHEVIQ